MTKPIIEVKNLSKRYRISHEKNAGYKTLQEDLIDLVKTPVRFLRGHRSSKEDFWALKDVSFKVNEGEVLGIIGRNGAGKSTLLKVLSRITSPTEGKAILRGRTASLLEVGTGFHPELTGRDNIFLNGTILGMSRREIQKKFDEIVAFSGIEKFLDTPVKFYSSGMHVRLAFAVAAHLEPEILMIDEVLAVGDTVFQKKCLGKMDEVAKQAGRTILFVSHNMGQIKKLCKRAILLTDGNIHRDGDSGVVVDEYISSGVSLLSNKKTESDNILESDVVSLKAFSIYGGKVGVPPRTGKPLNIELLFEFKKPVNNPGVKVFIRTLQGTDLMYLNSTPFGGLVIKKAEGLIRFKLTIEKLMLTGGQYTITVGMNRTGMEEYIVPAQIGQFEVQPDDYYSVGIHLLKTKVGVMAAKHKWSAEKMD